MSYAPPLGNAVNFTTPGAPYGPTPASAVDFIEYGWTVKLSASGAVQLGGSASVNSGVALSANGSIEIGGQAAVFAEVKFSANGVIFLGSNAAMYVAPYVSGAGQITFDGFVEIDAQPPQFDFKGKGTIALGGVIYDTGFLVSVAKPIKLSGVSYVQHGIAVYGAGKVQISGAMIANQGRGLSAQGEIKLGGGMNVGHWRGFHGSGSIALSGHALVSFRGGMTFSGSGKVGLSGYSVIAHPSLYNPAFDVFVRTTARSLHVVQ